tara:strand:+ start:2260 stop:2562 length:303 start_codon:yes stop_codon:yes gene_type:complete
MYGIIDTTGKQNRLLLKDSNGTEVAYLPIGNNFDAKTSSGHIVINHGCELNSENVVHVTSESGEKIGEIFMNNFEGVNFSFEDEGLHDLLNEDWSDQDPL